MKLSNLPSLCLVQALTLFSFASGFQLGPPNAARLAPERLAPLFSVSTDAEDSVSAPPDAVAADPPPRRRKKNNRGVRRMEKFARLPVWPAWNGALIFLVSRLLGNEIAAKLENAITGRVCPNFYAYGDTSPFIMLVHHCHTFNAVDPLRYFQRTFFPEGFPAHPHRGKQYDAITYLPSRLRHHGCD